MGLRKKKTRVWLVYKRIDGALRIQERVKVDNNGEISSEGDSVSILPYCNMEMTIS